MPHKRITKKKPIANFLPKGLKIIHEDRDILIINKPAGLLTVATKKEKIKTAYQALTNYVKKGISRSRNRIFIVHRLDKDTSGLLIFAKTEYVKNYLQDNWGETKKTYSAVVYGILNNKENTITTHLLEDKTHIMHSTKDTTKGKLSHTAYKVLKETKDRSLLEIDLLTGRKNQIRVHMAEIGHPIVGDKKYGDWRDTHKRLALHAKSITFKHPFTKKELHFETKIPAYFDELINEINEY